VFFRDERLKEKKDRKVFKGIVYEVQYEEVHIGGEEMIEVRKDEGRIKISFPYNPDCITKIKTIDSVFKA
jgi:hypothetical protein